MRFDSAMPVQSMVKYIEVANVMQTVRLDASLPSTPRAHAVSSQAEQFLIFIADNALVLTRHGEALPTSYFLLLTS